MKKRRQLGLCTIFRVTNYCLLCRFMQSIICVPHLFNILPITHNSKNNKCNNKTTELKHTSLLKRQLLPSGNQTHEQWLCNLTRHSVIVPFVVFIVLWMSFNVFSFIRCSCIATSNIFFTYIWLHTMTIILMMYEFDLTTSAYFLNVIKIQVFTWIIITLLDMFFMVFQYHCAHVLNAVLFVFVQQNQFSDNFCWFCLILETLLSALFTHLEKTHYRVLMPSFILQWDYSGHKWQLQDNSKCQNVV